MRLAPAVVAGLLALASLAAAQQGPNALAEGSEAALADLPDPQALTVSGAFYVPAYSSQTIGVGRFDVDLSVTLSIHNSSAEKPLVVSRIAYYDTAGQLVQDYLSEPVAIRPFGTIRVFVASNDLRGGKGANFVVDWRAVGPIAEPIMETLMIGTSGTHGFSFLSQGRPIRIVGGER